MKIVLFVEGSSDKETLSILAKRISPEYGIVTRVLGRGNLLNAQRISVYIEEDIKKQYRDVRKVLLCVDSECTPEREWERTVAPVRRALTDLVRHPPVFYCAVIHATEAWLACDAATLGLHLGSVMIKESSARAIARACKPKRALDDLFNRHDREFSNIRDNPRLAREVNIEVLTRNSKSFSRFARLVRNP